MAVPVLRGRLWRLLWLLVFTLLGLAHFFILTRLSSWLSDELYAPSTTSRVIMGMEREEWSATSTQTVPNSHTLQKTFKTLFSVNLSKDHQGKNTTKFSSKKEQLEHGYEDKLREAVEKAKRANATLQLLQKKKGQPQKKEVKEEKKQKPINNSTMTISPDDPSFLKLKQHGIEIPEEERHEIPAWSDITRSLGEEPVILGLEACEAYRNAVPQEQRVVAPAGNFNTGTNLFSVFFGKNCQGLDGNTLLQVPWGKHNPAQARLDNYRIDKPRYEKFPSEQVLPVVLVRHPISWMFSTCVHSYAAYWNHTNENCPHLVKDDATDATDPRALTAAHVAYGYRKTGKKYHRHKSLIHFWKEWYEGYTTQEFPFPRLVVRLEDIVYQPEKVITKLCECAGGIQRQHPNGAFVPEESVKLKRDRMRNQTLNGMLLKGSLARGKETAGLLKAWKVHASIPSLWDRMSSRDQQVVKQVLNDKDGLMKLLHYKIEGR